MGVVSTEDSSPCGAAQPAASEQLPWLHRMKVIKKIRRKMGLASRGGSGGTNNLPPVLFHQVHGDNIRISRDGAVARRAESFCKAITFSSRPIRINEKVCVKFVEVSNNWSGVIRFGFTSNDPSNLRNGLPKYACPDLTNKPGYWAKALAERFAERNAVLFYYVTQAGDVHFGIDGEEKGIFFSGVDTRGPLWSLVDVYGNSTAIEFVDPRQQLNNSRRSLMDGSLVSAEVDQLILPSLSALTFGQQRVPEDAAAADLPPVRYNQSLHPCPLPFHRTRGRNVRLSNDRSIAWRPDDEFCNGYVFTSRPIRLGEKIVIQIVKTDGVYVGGLAFGLTSCNPSTLHAADLPDDADLLLDRPEYWVVTKDVANSPRRGDELMFSIASNGEVRFSKNGSPPVVFMYVDHTLQLWGFIDLYGTTQKIRILGSSIDAAASNSANAAVASVVAASTSCMAESPRLQVSLPVTPPGPSPSPLPPSTSTPPPLSAALVVSLPPQQPPPSQPMPSSSSSSSSASSSAASPPLVLLLGGGGGRGASAAEPTPGLTVTLPPNVSGTLASTYSHTYVEPVTAPTAYSTLGSWEGLGNECSICYERPVDAVLYMCGHMCMCYSCAVQQWRGKGGGQCPICRALIRDVIRTYKS